MMASITNVVRPVIALLALALSTTLASCGAVQTKAHDPIGVGTLQPTQEDRDAGLVGIAPGFDLKAYRVITVERFPVAETDIKDADDRKLAADMQAFFQSELVRRLRASGLFDQVVNLTDTEFRPGPTKTLKLEGTITRLSGGSRALRFWIGFGSGRSKVQAETRFVDIRSGQVLMVTADRRVAAISQAGSLDYGGSSEDLFEESFDDMARDLVRFLTRLARGEAPKE